MAVQVITWAYQQDVPAGEDCSAASAKFLLVTLANYADADGVSWPSQERLMADTAMSERTLRRAIRRLQDLGLVVVKKRWRARGSQSSNQYRLQMVTGQDDRHAPATLAPLEPSDLTVTEDSPNVESSHALVLAAKKTPMTAEAKDARAALYAALAEIESPVELLDAAGGRRVALAVRQIEAQGGTAAMVPAREANYYAHFGDVACTALALAKWWSRCAAPPRRRVTTGAAATLALAAKLEEAGTA